MNTDRILRNIGKANPDAFVVQIGAMDGVSFDDIRGYTNTFNWNGLFVEPMPEMFDRLVSSYLHRDDGDVVFENSAISDYDGEIEMIRIPPDVVDSGKVHACFNGMSAVYPPRNGLGSEGDKKTVEQYAQKIKVPCITIQTLLKRHNISNIDILVIDAEGHDWQIFKAFDLRKYKPSFIKIEFINLTDTEQAQLKTKLTDSGYKYSISGQDINAIPITEEKTLNTMISTTVEQKTITLVTGIWNLNRKAAGEGFKRPFNHYVENFEKLLKTDAPMIIFIEKQYENIVWRHRTPENTHVCIREITEFKDNFDCYTQVQKIRQDKKWLDQAEWLQHSTQATLQYYNPMVMSKMFMLNDASIWNPFGTEYFAWIDGGITNTVHEGYFTHDKIIPKLQPYLNDFFFISFPYTGNTEIHGFDRAGMNEYCETEFVDYVCRGGFFGGHIDNIQQASGHYYGLLKDTLNNGYMGTEESVFTIMAHTEPETYKRYMINDDGLVNTFFEKVKNDKVVFTKPPLKVKRKKLDVDLNNIKTNLYVITFNSPAQFETLIKTYNTQSGFLSETEKYVLNNSTDRSTDKEYDKICKQYNFTQIKKNNIGICGGRQYVAEHFDKTDADLYIFLEDDMMLADESATVCKNGFPEYIPNLYEKIQKIIVQEGYDFLKLSFTEFFGDNNTQWAWYNVPSTFRVKHWPGSPKLPKTGLDKHSPKTKFNNIGSIDGLPYIDGEIYYCNWPQIVSRDGNKKMFLKTTWNHPHEQTWMSHMFQETVKGAINGGVLLASPIHHDRFDHYNEKERIES